MSRIVVGALALVAGGALAFAVAGQSSGATVAGVERGSKAFTPCYHYLNQKVVYKKRPGRCDFAPPGCPAAMCVDPFKDIKWKSYGGRTAKAKGKPFINGPGWMDPIKFKLTKIRDPRCGPPVYTKITYKSGGSYRLAHCR